MGDLLPFGRKSRAPGLEASRPDISKSLAQFDTLLPDLRVERIREQLLQMFPSLGDDMQIATYVQDRQMLQDPETGIMKPYEEQAVFVMVSPNPHKRHVGDIIKTNAFTSLKNWREGEKEYRHSADVDLALNFFKAIAREHLEVLTNWRELV